MGLVRFAPGAARSLRLLVGSGGCQRDLERSDRLLARCRSRASNGSLGEEVLKFSVPGRGRPFREYNCTTVFHLQPASPIFYSTFSKSAGRLEKVSTQDVQESSSGSRKKSSKTKTSEKGSYKLKPQERPIAFECVECKAMCVKRILKDPYDRGVVIVRCMDCRSVNLISDQLGLFKEPGSMQKFLIDQGVDVMNGPESSYELTPEKLSELSQASAG